MGKEIISDGLTEVLEIIKKEGIARLLAQGHDATGQGINTLSIEIDNIGNGFRGSLLGQQYLLAQDTGFKATYHTKFSYDYIKNLMEWIRLKGIYTQMGAKAGKPMSLSRRRSLAFAISKTHSVKGMHTTGGSHDSSKQGWLSKTIDENELRIRTIIEEAGFKFFESMIQSMVIEANRNK